MARVRFITRADDLGSSLSANRAIDTVSRAGIIKNVSVMAPSPFVRQAAELLARRKDICFGMHTTLNAEWDKVKWGPLTSLDQSSGLVDENGYFLNDPSLFARSRPQVETIMREVDAQLERLHALGFAIRYIDSHMFPEMHVEGLDECMQEFARKKGLIDHMYFYKLPPGIMELPKTPAGIYRYFRKLPAGQYFLAAHPSLYTDEMLMTGNTTVSGETIARDRANETKTFSSAVTRLLLLLSGCKGIRYDEAKPFDRLTPDDIAKQL